MLAQQEDYVAKTKATKETPGDAPASRFPAVDVLPAIAEELALAPTVGSNLMTFFKDIAAFLTQASEWEKAAHGTLLAARALRRPTSQVEDEAVQRLIKRARDQKKGIVDGWDITSTLSGIHKRFVAHRQRPVGYLDEAITLATAQHNAYAEEERRRVELENERRRKLEEARAQEQRQKELEQLEKMALEQEAASPDLSEREARFVELFAFGNNSAATAARSAGYKNPETIGERLAASAKIRSACDALLQAKILREQAAAVKDTPLEVGEVEQAKPEIGRAGTERTTWSAEIYDEAAFMKAYRAGVVAIPDDAARPDPVRLNQYAQGLHEQINAWPGVRARKKTGVV